MDFVTAICNIGLVSTSSTYCDYLARRLAGGLYESADYHAGDRFEVVDDLSSKRWLLKSADGLLIAVSAGDFQCFEYID